jgi:hypothetical protein
VLVTIDPTISLRQAAPVPQHTACVASTLNLGTCDGDSGNVTLDVPVTIDPDVDLDLSDIL